MPSRRWQFRIDDIVEAMRPLKISLDYQFYDFVNLFEKPR